MNLLASQKIFQDIDRVINVVNTTIGLLEMRREIVDEDIVQLIFADYAQNEVSEYLRKELYSALLNDYQDSYDPKFVVGTKAYQDCDEILITYKLNNNPTKENKNILGVLVNDIYFAVDSTKVEFNDIVKFNTEADIENFPLEILDQLDNWNEECEYEGNEITYIEDMYIYSLPKTALYSISLGYHDIKEDIIESDFIPELMGSVLDIVDGFFSITSYEDENIYFYVSEELTDEQIDSIEEAIMDNLPYCSVKNQDETLEDLYQDYADYAEEK